MQLYLAPMEEVTGFIFRNVTDRHFPGADRYITPFVSPNQKNILKTKDGREINPEHNEGKQVAVQIMGNRSEEVAELAGYLKELGYGEINLNFGCPSDTVAKKFRGSGMLRDLKQMEDFLYELFSDSRTEGLKISVKTRLGYDSDEYWDEIIDIYNRYPLSELIVHPRIKTDYYNGVPRVEKWKYSVENYKGALCYNGDVNTAKAYEKFVGEWNSPNITGVMIGRGAVRNPGIFREIKTGERTTASQLKEWHNDLYETYASLYGEKDAMFKLKEVWFYLSGAFAGSDKAMKAIRKSGNRADYMAAVREMWHCEYIG